MALQGRVLKGPFAGMRYGRNAVASSYPPKILGTYEKELHPLWEKWATSPPRRVVDIGSAEGYYAVGFARLWKCPVDAYEMDPVGRQLLAENAELNELKDRICQFEKATPELLETHMRGLTHLQPGELLVFCDIEGAEEAVLDPILNPALKTCRLVVELHEFISTGIGDKLKARFQDSHHQEEIHTTDRVSSDFPSTCPGNRLLSAKSKARIIQEHRPAPMSWLILTPKSVTQIYS